MNEVRAWPVGDGDMARRIREFAWSGTPLGSLSEWPQSLRTIVDLILAMPVPATVLWGPESIQLYNDAYRAIARDHHPALLGKPVREGWADAHAAVIQPLIDAARAGRATQLTEFAVELAVADGRLEQRMFDTDWVPVRDESGAVAGCLQTLIEATERTESRRALRVTDERYRALATAGSYAVYRMSPDWKRMFELRGQEFLSDTSEPSESWIDSYIIEEDRDVVRSAISEAIRGKTMFELKHRVVLADGSIGWTWSRAVPILDERGLIREWVGTATDVTSEEEVRQERRRTEKRQSFLLKMSDALRPLVDPAAIQDTASRILGEHLRVMRAAYGEIEPGGEMMTVESDWHRPGATSAAGRFRIDDAGEFFIGPLRTGQVTTIDDVATDPRVTPEMRAKVWDAVGVRAAMAAPIVKGGQLSAIFFVHEDDARSWTAEDVSLVLEVANRTWDAVHRARAEAALRDSERHQRVLLAELQHRVRSTLAVVRSIASRTADNSGSVDQMIAHFQGRLDAFSRVQAAVTRSADGLVDLASLIEDEMVAHAARDGEQLRITGPDVALDSRTAERLSLAIHELTTNAVKHGALSSDEGQVAICWVVEDDAADGDILDLHWDESGITLEPRSERREGFGMELLLRSLPYDLKAETRLDFQPGGLSFALQMPLSHREP